MIAVREKYGRKKNYETCEEHSKVFDSLKKCQLDLYGMFRQIPSGEVEDFRMILFCSFFTKEFAIFRFLWKKGAVLEGKRSVTRE